MNHIKNIWKCFEEKHATFAKWLYQIFYFVIFSMGVTVFQYLVFTFLPGILGIGLAGTEFMWPKVSMNLFGVKKVVGGYFRNRRNNKKYEKLLKGAGGKCR